MLPQNLFMQGKELKEAEVQMVLCDRDMGSAHQEDHLWKRRGMWPVSSHVWNMSVCTQLA